MRSTRFRCCVNWDVDTLLRFLKTESSEMLKFQIIDVKVSYVVGITLGTTCTDIALTECGLYGEGGVRFQF